MGWLALAMALTMATKENVPLTTAMLGLYMAVVRRMWIPGAVAIVASAVWFLVGTYVVIPAFNVEGQGWLWNRYGGMGGTPLQIVGFLLENPRRFVEPGPGLNNLSYVAKLLFPLGFLSLLDPFAFAVGLPGARDEPPDRLRADAHARDLPLHVDARRGRRRLGDRRREAAVDLGTLGSPASSHLPATGGADAGDRREHRARSRDVARLPLLPRLHAAIAGVRLAARDRAPRRRTRDRGDDSAGRRRLGAVERLPARLRPRPDLDVPLRRSSGVRLPRRRLAAKHRSG